MCSRLSESTVNRTESTTVWHSPIVTFIFYLLTTFAAYPLHSWHKIPTANSIQVRIATCHAGSICNVLSQAYMSSDWLEMYSQYVLTLYFSILLHYYSSYTSRFTDHTRGIHTPPEITPIGSNTCSGYNQQVMEIEVLNYLNFKCLARKNQYDSATILAWYFTPEDGRVGLKHVVYSNVKDWLNKKLY
jgi:hypothetical protein